MKLNLGCGSDIKKGWVNLDVANIDGVDVVHNINELPLPFENETFDEILCQDILEHVDYVNILRDIHRILKKGGVLNIRVPHFTSYINYCDPTHKNRFSVNTFDFFTQQKNFGGRSYYFNFAFENLLEKKILFDKHWLLHRIVIEFFVNINDKTKSIYEKTSLCYLFPALNIQIKIIK